MISGKFLKSTLAYSVAGALPMLSGFILLPFYTNLLSTSDYGLLMLYVGFSLLVQVIVSYALDAYIGAHYTDVKHDGTKRKELVSNVAGLLLVIGLAFIALSFVAGKQAFDFTLNRSGSLEFFPYGMMSVVTGFFNGFFKVYTYLLVFENKPGRYFVFNLLNFLLTIAISVVGLHLYPDSLIGPMYGRLLSGVGIFVFSLWSVAASSGISFQFRKLRDLHAFCLPYLAYVMLVWVTGNLDRFIINDIMSADRVAVFDFAIKCTLLIDFIQGGIATAVNPQVYSIWNTNQSTGTTKESNKYFSAFTAISMVVICGFMVFIPLLIPLLVKRTDYYESFVFMGLLAGSFATRGLYHYFLSILIYLKKTRVLLIVFVLATVIQLPLTWTLTYFYGVNGTVIATVAAKIAQVFFLYLFTRRFFTIKVNPVKMIFLPLLLLIVLGVLWFFSTEWNLAVYCALFVAVSVALFLVYRNEAELLWVKVIQPRLPGRKRK